MCRCTLAISLAVVALATQIGQAGSTWVEFSEETSTRLIADTSLGFTDNQEKDYAFGDVDQDGDIDVVCVRKNPFTTAPGRRNVLFLNEGIAEGRSFNGIFVDRTLEFVTDANDGGQGFLDTTNDRDVILADVNRDGWLDIITAVTVSDGMPKTMSHPRVYINLQSAGGNWNGFRYEESRIPALLTIPAGQALAPRFCSVDAGDVTGDEAPDLYFGDYDGSGAGGSQAPPGSDFNDRLLVNDGAGNFTDSTQSRMSATMLESAFGMAVAIRDMNNDGVNDVVKDTALNVPQRVSISYNDPNNEGFFDEFEVIYTNSPYHITVDDLNNDGMLDIVVTDDGRDSYLINTGNGADGLANFTTRDFIRAAGADGEFGGNHAVADLNNDGFKDVIITDVDVDSPGCNRRMHIYRNLGDVPLVTLQEQTSVEPWTPNGVHDIAVFDINEDGWLDMFIGTCTGTEIWINQPPVSLIFTYPDGLPGIIEPGQPLDFRVVVLGTGGATPRPGTGRQFMSIDGGPFIESPMTVVSFNEYRAQLPAVDCASTVRFYFTSETVSSTIVSDPGGAPGNVYSSVATFGTNTPVSETFESVPATGWTTEVVNPGTTTGAWEQVDPIGTFFPTGSSTPAQPENDFGAAGDETTCFITGQHPGGTAGANDVDGGPVRLVSPIIDLAGTDGTVSYARWHFSDTGTVIDSLVTEITSNGSDWVVVDSTESTAGEWEAVSFKVSDFVNPTATVQVRFSVEDDPNDSITDSGIDNFRVDSFICTPICGGPEDCADGLFCNGAEQCVNDACTNGSDPCPGQLCDETTDACVDCLDNGDCDDNVFCNGPEICSNGACVTGSAPCGGATPICDETNDACVACLDDGDCADGAFCNGVEICDAGTCVPGSDPCPGVGCDEVADACTDCNDSLDCDDGVFCNGVETCDNGACVTGEQPCGDLTCDEAAAECVRLPQPRTGQPVLGLTPDQLARFTIGRTRFTEDLTAENGLGPIFNQSACGDCHNAGAVGGSGSQMVTRFGRQGKNGFDPMDQFGGSLLQAQTINEQCAELIPPTANVISNRITNSTFGAGLVEAIPDEAILAVEGSQPPGITGVVHMVPMLEDLGGPPRVGRYGWKAQLATVLSFSADAALMEMGLTNRILQQENDPNGINPPTIAECDTVADPEDGPEDGPGGVEPHFIDRVTDFQRFLAPPPQTPRSGMAGEAVFNSVGCNQCHVREFLTGPAPETALAFRTIRPYSDYLLHDMGNLGDGIEQGLAGATEIRTPSLWGVRVRGQLLHDGRVLGGTFAERMDAAIQAHGATGSEAVVSVALYNNLAQPDKDALIAFLDSLGRAEFDQDGDNDVDLDDAAVIADSCFSGPGAFYTPDDPCAVSDFDQDGDVDLGDWQVLQQVFTGDLQP